MLIRHIHLTYEVFITVTSICFVANYLAPDVFSLSRSQLSHLHDPLKGAGRQEEPARSTTVATEDAHNGNVSIFQSQRLDPVETPSYEAQIKNSTLGFGKIIAIGLAQRTDRRDKLRLMSNYQGVDLEWSDAVRGKDMVDEALPPGVMHGDSENMTLPEAGCWRSHSDALLNVIESGIESALIIEDDADWDVGLKAQMVELAKASRELDDDIRPDSTDNQVGSEPSTGSPYGDYWDLLWIGPCFNPPLQPGSRSQIFVSEYGQSHYVYPIEGTAAGTTGYAVTAKSARTLFGFLQDAKVPIDIDMEEYCRHRECRLVWPQLISSRSYGRDSEIRKEDKFEEIADPNQGTWNIKNSAIVDMLVKNHLSDDAMDKS